MNAISAHGFVVKRNGTGIAELRATTPPALQWSALDVHRRTGEHSFNSNVVVAALVNAVQELAARIDALDGRKEPDIKPVLDHAAAIGLDVPGVAEVIARDLAQEKVDDAIAEKRAARHALQSKQAAKTSPIDDTVA